MPNASVGTVVSVAGLSLGSTVARTATAEIQQDVALPAAKAGTLLATPSGGYYVITDLPSGHGFVVGQDVDIFWDGGHIGKARLYQVNANDIRYARIPDVEGGSSPQPAIDTPVAVAKRVAVEIDWPANSVQVLVAQSTCRTRMAFYSPTHMQFVVWIAPGEEFRSIKGTPEDHLVDATPIHQVFASCADAAGDAALQIIALYASA
jgi:hypothetical protein